MSKWNPDDHLPECGVTRYPICICDRLRACEQRVKESTIKSLSPFLIPHKDDLIRINYKSGYVTGLLEAREALEGLLHEDPCDCDTCRVITQAQAAIDALRVQPAERAEDNLRGES